jgi:hypothetical protein
MRQEMERIRRMTDEIRRTQQDLEWDRSERDLERLIWRGRD